MTWLRVRPVLLGLVMAAALAAVAAGCSGSPTAKSTTTTTTTAPPEDLSAAYLSEVATARGPAISVYANPDDAEPMLELDNPWVIDPDVPDATVPQVFLVAEPDPAAGASDGGSSDEWVEVLLPIRPNGSTGWVRRADVTIAENPYRIGIELAAHRITVTNAGSVVYQGAIAAGAADTPTPTGTYYLRVLLEAPDPNTAYGPFAYGLSSHSDALETFNGGDAEIGIHGNNDASVLGSDVTHGCVRIDNEAITTLTGLLPLGTPVDIIA